MKKKLFKYIKTILALTLIAALTLPSYAAINAADGSAFVTKAEFDAALSDFNARLTTFEAGINSKIDSQVSSYLDRNGIWNGKVQEFVQTKKMPTGSTENNVAGVYWDGDQNKIKFYPVWGAHPDKTVGLNDTGKCAYFSDGYDNVYMEGSGMRKTADLGVVKAMYDFTRNTVHRTYGKYKMTEYNLIKNISKSGLLCLNYSTAPTDDRWKTWIYFSPSPWRMDIQIDLAVTPWAPTIDLCLMDNEEERLPETNYYNKIAGVLPGLVVVDQRPGANQIKKVDRNPYTGWSTVNTNETGAYLAWQELNAIHWFDDVSALVNHQCDVRIMTSGWTPSAGLVTFFVKKGQNLRLVEANNPTGPFYGTLTNYYQHFTYWGYHTYGNMGWKMEASVY